MSAVNSKYTCTWRLVDGKTQIVAFTSAAAFASSAVGAQTNCVRLSASGANCQVRINQGTAASATQGALIKSSDPPIYLLCGGGDKVEIWGLGSGSLYIDELSG